MHKIFLEALEQLLPRLTTTGTISATYAPIDDHAACLNRFHKGSAFQTSIHCNQGSVYAPPIPFIAPSPDGAYNYLHLSVNPGLAKASKPSPELRSATGSDDWRDYADFYVDAAKGKAYHHILPSKFFTSRLKLIWGIQKCKFPTDAPCKTEGNGDTDFIKENGILFAHTVPFRSSNAGIDLGTLCGHIKACDGSDYPGYHHYLLEKLIGALNNRGTIIVDGKLAADAFLCHAYQYGSVTNVARFDCYMTPVAGTTNEPKATLLCYNGHPAVVLHDFIGARTGCFNSAHALAAVVNAFCHHFRTNPC